jgi:hypothetical protein
VPTQNPAKLLPLEPTTLIREEATNFSTSGFEVDFTAVAPKERNAIVFAID